MDKQELIEKIIQKKEFSQLPRKDVEMAFEKFDNEKYGDEEKVKLTRKLLREVFSAFASQKLLKLKDKGFEWVLKKHVSTRERFPYYEEIYKRIFQGESARPPAQKVQSPTQPTIFDLGAGINGFSYEYLVASVLPTHPKAKSLARPKYIAIEAMGQLVELMNNYFEKEELNARAIQMSLFELEKLKELIGKGDGHTTGVPRKILEKDFYKGHKIVFLFKTLDSLEMMQRDYSKELLKEITPLVDKVVVSFAVRSIGSRQRFRANRKWLLDFIKENFKVKDDFELGGERYVVFSKR